MLLVVAVIGMRLGSESGGGGGGARAAAAPSWWAMVGNLFAGGVLLSTALVHLLPDAAEGLADLSEFPCAGAAAGGGYLLMLLIEASRESSAPPPSHGHGHGVGEEEAPEGPDAGGAADDVDGGDDDDASDAEADEEAAEMPGAVEMTAAARAALSESSEAGGDLGTAAAADGSAAKPLLCGAGHRRGALGPAKRHRTAAAALPRRSRPRGGGRNGVESLSSASALLVALLVHAFVEGVAIVRVVRPRSPGSCLIPTRARGKPTNLGRELLSLPLGPLVVRDRTCGFCTGSVA